MCELEDYDFLVEGTEYIQRFMDSYSGIRLLGYDDEDDNDNVILGYLKGRDFYDRV